MDFEGEQFFITWNGNRAAHGITFKLDPTKSPRTIELKAGEMEYSGIYEIKGDRLRICYSPKMRPTKFEPFEKEGETNVLFELERK